MPDDDNKYLVGPLDLEIMALFQRMSWPPKKTAAFLKEHKNLIDEFAVGAGQHKGPKNLALEFRSQHAQAIDSFAEKYDKGQETKPGAVVIDFKRK